MKLLFENWRRFIKEDIGYFGKKFVQFKEMVDAGHHPLKVAKLYLQYLGKGSTRMVFGFKDNDTHILKVINVELIDNEEAYDADYVNPFTGFTRKHKLVSNENEADLMMQQKYPDIFPRTYEYAEDYSWILVEKVDPLTDEELAVELGIPTALTAKDNRKTYFVMLDMAMNQLRDTMINEAEDTVAMDSEQLQQARAKTREDYEREELSGFTFAELQEIAAKLLEDEHIRKLLRAVIKLEIPPREIQAKNLGISKFGADHLVILDASLWEYDHDGGSMSKHRAASEQPAAGTFNF